LTVSRELGLRGELAGWALSRPSPGHELIETRGRPEIDEFGEQVGEVGLRIDAIEFAGLCRPPNYAESGPV
jgi:hypothetical protein